MVVETLKRFGIIIGMVVLVAVSLVVATRFLRRSLVLFYILGWLLALISLNIRQTRINETKASEAIMFIEGISFFLFALIGFRTLIASNMVGTFLAVAGIAVIAYNFSL